MAATRVCCIGQNFESLATAVSPLLDAEGKKSALALVAMSEAVSSDGMDDMWRQKLGLLEWPAASADPLLGRLMRLMSEHAVDYTIFFRQLASVAGA